MNHASRSRSALDELLDIDQIACSMYDLSASFTSSYLFISTFNNQLIIIIITYNYFY